MQNASTKKYLKYPATVTAEADGEYIVSFRQLPEVLTSGETEKEALINAVDALAEGLASRLATGELIPHPEDPQPGEILVPTTMRDHAVLVCR